jgi:micrococcal nuclease
MVARHRQRFAMSRRRRNGLFVLAIALLATCGWLDRQFGGCIRIQVVRHAHWGLDGLKYHGSTFTVINVVDGDTLDLLVSDGPNEYTRVRLLGIDTPETRDPRVGTMYYGPEASAFAESLVKGMDVTVVLDGIGDVRDVYGRLLAYIRLQDGRVLNEELISNGFGYADLRFGHSQFDRYVALQKSAIDTEAGLWKDVKRDQLPRWLQRQRPDLCVRH